MSRNDTEHLMRSPENARRLQRAIDQLNAGRGVEHDPRPPRTLAELRDELLADPDVRHAYEQGLAPDQPGTEALAEQIVDLLLDADLDAGEVAAAVVIALDEWSSEMEPDDRRQFAHDFAQVLVLACQEPAA